MCRSVSSDSSFGSLIRTPAHTHTASATTSDMHALQAPPERCKRQTARASASRHEQSLAVHPPPTHRTSLIGAFSPSARSPFAAAAPRRRPCGPPAASSARPASHCPGWQHRKHQRPRSWSEFSVAQTQTLEAQLAAQEEAHAAAIAVQAAAAWNAAAAAALEATHREGMAAAAQQRQAVAAQTPTLAVQLAAQEEAHAAAIAAQAAE